MGFFKNIFNSKETATSNENSFAENEQIFSKKKIVIGVDDSGNPIQEEKNISLHFKTQNGYINIDNPFNGIGVFGGPGAGKSISVIRPSIIQMIRNGFTGLVHDIRGQYSSAMKTSINSQGFDFYEISFEKATYNSVRFNPLHPSKITNLNVALRYATFILNASSSEGNNKDYFSESRRDYLASIIWYLKQHHPQYCTLPHLLSIIKHGDAEKIIQKLGQNEECFALVHNLLLSINKEMYEMMAGVVGALKVMVEKMINKEAFWTLSGEDFILDFNNPQKPKWLLFKDRPTANTNFAISIAAETATTLGMPSAIILDEIGFVAPVLQDLHQVVYNNNNIALVIGGYYRSIELNLEKQDKKLFLENIFWGGEFLTETEAINYITEYSKNKGITILPEDIYNCQQGKFWVKTSKNISFDQIVLDEYDQLEMKDSSQNSDNLIIKSELDENFDRIKKEALSLI